MDLDKEMAWAITAGEIRLNEDFDKRAARILDMGREIPSDIIEVLTVEHSFKELCALRHLQRRTHERLSSCRFLLIVVAVELALLIITR